MLEHSKRLESQVENVCLVYLSLKIHVVSLLLHFYEPSSNIVNLPNFWRGHFGVGVDLKKKLICSKKSYLYSQTSILIIIPFLFIGLPWWLRW